MTPERTQITGRSHANRGHRVAILTAAILAMGAGDCGNGGNATRATAPAAKPPAVTIETIDGRRFRVEVEVVRDERARRRGMMFRERLAPDHGMFFVFDHEAIQTFYMKNTLIPLDMLFISRERELVGIIHSAEPLTEYTRAVERPSLYVLEVNGGWARAHRVEAGSRIEIENVAL